MALNISEVVLFGVSVVGGDVIATAPWGTNVPIGHHGHVLSGPRLGPEICGSQGTWGEIGERCSSISNPLLVCGQHQKNSQDTGSVCEELDWKTGKGWQF